ncbi:hypothetical protein [Tahibacter soli]|uniref:Uncharacterized protein n=1 Tax=Tahibacter soli TaxID=2983605 RepID=A0A9X3YJ70_9GAMM|nr:hypothetical protein [Tahibacter soli]MDC8012542.1 hypothetical protein [Tahibacter soli]
MTSSENATSPRIAGFVLPEQLQRLIDIGMWPARVDPGCVKAFAPNESTLDLCHPKSFATIASHLRPPGGMTPEQWAVQDIDPDRTLIIADFGLGSDAPIALDYRHDASEPSVIRLVWGEGERPRPPNRWQQVAPTFDGFWAMIRLRRDADDR